MAFNPLSPASADAVIAFQNTAAWSELMAAVRKELPAFAGVNQIPDVAAACANRRAGAEEMLDMLLWLPRLPKAEPAPAVGAPVVREFIDMSDSPRGAPESETEA